jgi:hypothetical protein
MALGGVTINAKGRHDIISDGEQGNAIHHILVNMYKTILLYKKIIYMQFCMFLNLKIYSNQNKLNHLITY